MNRPQIFIFETADPSRLIVRPLFLEWGDVEQATKFIADMEPMFAKYVGKPYALVDNGCVPNGVTTMRILNDAVAQFTYRQMAIGKLVNYLGKWHYASDSEC